MKNILLLSLTIILVSACDVIVPTPIPVPTASPVASAQPSPTIQPTATPMPSPSPSPSPVFGCQLSDMPECGAGEGPSGVYGCCDCNTPPDTFTDAVENAIETLRLNKPQYFSGEKVLNESGYMKGVVKVLKERGYCSKIGAPEDELGIKTTNSYSVQVDILTGDGYIRHRAPTCKCTPARF